MNEILKVIKERRTTRKFKPEQISDSELNTIIEAGLYAPSAHNHQSWNFTVVQNLELISEMNVEAKLFATRHPDELVRKMGNNEMFSIFYGAPTVIIVSGEECAMMPQVDCAAATQNMLLAAESMDVGGCWNAMVRLLLESDKLDHYKKKLNIPDGFTPYYAVLFGYKEVRLSAAPSRREGCINYVR